VELDLSGSNFQKQFKRADRHSAIACLILGDQEVDQGTVNLKWMASQEQSVMEQAQLLAAPEKLQQQLVEASANK
jgi:histidyl-tRNA synthetase